MITGVHSLIYTQDADGMRAFFRDILGFPCVDSGGGWLIFELPPAELGVHPSDGETTHTLSLMCDDIHATVAALKSKGVEFTRAVSEQGWGLVTAIQLPDGAELGLYQPKHPTALSTTR